MMVLLLSCSAVQDGRCELGGVNIVVRDGWLFYMLVRGEVLWMVDLGELVGLAPWHRQTYIGSNHKAIVIHNSGEKLGLIVNQVQDIEICNTDEIKSPPASSVTPELIPFVRGYWLKPNGEILMVIDPETIMAAMPKP